MKAKSILYFYRKHTEYENLLYHPDRIFSFFELQ